MINYEATRSQDDYQRKELLARSCAIGGKMICDEGEDKRDDYYGVGRRPEKNVGERRNS